MFVLILDLGNVLLPCSASDGSILAQGIWLSSHVNFMTQNILMQANRFQISFPQGALSILIG